MGDLKDNSKDIRRIIQRNLVAGLNRGNEFLTTEAASAAPVKTGTLQEGTEVVDEATETNPVAVGASKATYAAAVNRHNTPFWSQAWIRMKAQMGEFFRG